MKRKFTSEYWAKDSYLIYNEDGTLYQNITNGQQDSVDEVFSRFKTLDKMLYEVKQNPDVFWEVKTSVRDSFIIDIYDYI